MYLVHPAALEKDIFAGYVAQAETLKKLISTGCLKSIQLFISVSLSIVSLCNEIERYLV